MKCACETAAQFNFRAIPANNGSKQNIMSNSHSNIGLITFLEWAFLSFPPLLPPQAAQPKLEKERHPSFDTPPGMGRKLKKELMKIAGNFAIFVERCSRHHPHTRRNWFSGELSGAIFFPIYFLNFKWISCQIDSPAQWSLLFFHRLCIEETVGRTPIQAALPLCLSLALCCTLLPTRGDLVLAADRDAPGLAASLFWSDIHGL